MLELKYATFCVHKVLKIVLVNSNPATIITARNMADRIYMEPLIFLVLKWIILKGKTDFIIVTLGGQTDLMLAYRLDKEELPVKKYFGNKYKPY